MSNKPQITAYLVTFELLCDATLFIPQTAGSILYIDINSRHLTVSQLAVTTFTESPHTAFVIPYSKTRSSANADWLKDVMCQSKSRQLLHNCRDKSRTDQSNGVRGLESNNMHKLHSSSHGVTGMIHKLDVDNFCWQQHQRVLSYHFDRTPTDKHTCKKCACTHREAQMSKIKLKVKYNQNPSASLTKTRTSSHQGYLLLASSF